MKNLKQTNKQMCRHIKVKVLMEWWASVQVNRPTRQIVNIGYTLIELNAHDEQKNSPTQFVSVCEFISKYFELIEHIVVGIFNMRKRIL